MTPYLTRILAACDGQWLTAQEIANRMTGKLPGQHIVPNLRRLEVAGKLLRDESGTWHRWRAR